ncbi:hypothetical protein [Ensifer sp. ZNC0028]|uniref:hypothetical protein n=1 Tax=Ensifer sp. ZNC0028 TaxID=1339236 RepID=UPI0005B7C372|nr:hypothetical protein [Ensifer sp. ZNC0028]
MRRFEVYLGDQLVGHTVFEHGDRSMAVAYGEFFPTGAYHRDMANENSDFTVRLGDVPIRCAGVAIEDYFEEAGEIEVAALGIWCPAYDELFPERARTGSCEWPQP